MIESLLSQLRDLPPHQHANHVAVLILALEERRHGYQWLSSRFPRRPPSEEGMSLAQALKKAGISLTERQNTRLTGCQTLPDLLRGFHLKGVPLDCQEGLLGWIEGRYPLDLRLDIPSPDEMLDHQCRGRRYVTFRPEWDLLFQPLGRHAGSLEFALHDLEHAHKFFGDPSTMNGQIHFFRYLRAALSNGMFDELRRDTMFSHELDYLMADMNSHPVHLWKYLKAIVMNAHFRQGHSDYEDFTQNLMRFWAWPEEVCASANRINRPGVETESDRVVFSGHFVEKLL